MKMTPTRTGVGLVINHFVNIVTNVFTPKSLPSPHGVPGESLGIPGTLKGFLGECDVLVKWPNEWPTTGPPPVSYKNNSI